ncbi:hypothetical protein M3Y99_00599200 [Aphelenchoides fujianensis]|nr:hypothetical protein M3Y99_00599200 [Aphelenchoides fujianensis]
MQNFAVELPVVNTASSQRRRELWQSGPDSTLSEKKAKYQYSGLNSGRPVQSPQRAQNQGPGGQKKK